MTPGRAVEWSATPQALKQPQGAAATRGIIMTAWPRLKAMGKIARGAGTKQPSGVAVKATGVVKARPTRWPRAAARVTGAVEVEQIVATRRFRARGTAGQSLMVLAMGAVTLKPRYKSG